MLEGLFGWSMEIPTHGGEINIALLSEAVANIEHGDILALDFIEGFEGQDGVFLFGDRGPICDPLGIETIHVIHHAQAIDVVDVHERFYFGDHAFHGSNAKILAMDGIGTPFTAIRAAA